MPDTPVIRAEGLGKSYLLRHKAQGRGYVALRDVIADAGRGALTRLRRRGEAHPDATRELYWALRDLDFEIAAGDVVGIIGRNGAGKSTLLKLLSRITDPSEGRATLRGRVASLLEVGTGFHPELTGRENIYLNGAILGMKRREIRARFDEIVAFAEVEKFLDTPVKRYSSGMYVRLAFAVAAHLDPEILIVDEVLAVGDAEFQKKCLGKMQQVGRAGRTILFVSHNMAAVKSLTTRGIVLAAGRKVFDGTTDAAIEAYGRMAGGAGGTGEGWGRGAHTRIAAARLLGGDGRAAASYVAGDPLRIEVEVETDGARNLSVEALLVDPAKAKLALASTYQFGGVNLPAEPGRWRVLLDLAPLALGSGSYTVDLTTSIVNHDFDHYVEDALAFEVAFCNPGGRAWDFRQSHGYGALALPFAASPLIERVAA